MAKTDKPWWGKGHSLWGGETFTSLQTKPNIGIETGDKFRIEREKKNGGGFNTTLIPHKDNAGKWNETYSKTNPIKLTQVNNTGNDRAFSMMVKIAAASPTTMQLFFIERPNGTTAITDDVEDDGEVGDGTASVER